MCDEISSLDIKLKKEKLIKETFFKPFPDIFCEDIFGSDHGPLVVRRGHVLLRHLAEHRPVGDRARAAQSPPCLTPHSCVSRNAAEVQPMK